MMPVSKIVAIELFNRNSRALPVLLEDENDGVTHPRPKHTQALTHLCLYAGTHWCATYTIFESIFMTYVGL